MEEFKSTEDIINFCRRNGYVIVLDNDMYMVHDPNLAWGEDQPEDLPTVYEAPERSLLPVALEMLGIEVDYV